MKIKNDKYYTPSDVVNLCLDGLESVIGELGQYDYIEPSAGRGAFIRGLLTRGVSLNKITSIEKYIDDESEAQKLNIKEGDYLTKKFKGSIVIGNPPYGSRFILGKQFYKKAVKENAEYICFIYPISQLNNEFSLFDYPLIKSIDLGVVNFGECPVDVCFNIYKRINPINKAPKIQLDCLTFTRQDRSNYLSAEYDILFCYWGNSCAGKICTKEDEYSAMYKIKIHDDELREEIIEKLSTADWRKEFRSTAGFKIQQHRIITYLKKNVEGIY